MKILIITPSYPPEISGNATTASRIVEGLNEKGIDTLVCISKDFPKKECVDKVKKFDPDIIHAFHAYKSGVNALELKKIIRKPLIVTITGTDINHDIFNKNKKDYVIDVLKGSDCITVFHESIKRKVRRFYDNEITIIKQSVRLKDDKCDIRAKLNLSEKDIIFFVPSALRKIKYGYFYLDRLGQLKTLFPGLKVIVAGRAIEKRFAKAFLGRIEGLSWIRYIEKIPHEKMKCVFEDIDIVLNSSISEGGMSNSVLEAMSVAKPVLASDIEGNRSIIMDNLNGMLFADKEEFSQKAKQLIKDEQLRKAVGKKAKQIIETRFRFADEINSYIDCYKKI